MDFELDELYALFPDLFESCGSAVATGSSSNSGSASAAGSSNSGISVNNYLPPLIIPGNDANNVHGNLGSNSLAEVSSPHNSAATQYCRVISHCLLKLELLNLDTMKNCLMMINCIQTRNSNNFVQ